MSIENARERTPKRRGLVAKSIAIALGATSPAGFAEAQNTSVSNSEASSVCVAHEQNPLRNEIESLVMGGFGRIEIEHERDGIHIYTLNTLDDLQIERLVRYFNNCALRSSELQAQYRPFIERLLLEITARQESRAALRSPGGNITSARARYRQTYLASGVDIEAIERAQVEVAESFSNSSAGNIASVIANANSAITQRIATIRIASRS